MSKPNTPNKLGIIQSWITVFLLTVFSSTTVIEMAYADSSIRVAINHARVLQLDRPVSKVIIGNSGIANVVVSDTKTIVLTGKGAGTTNLVLLDSQGNAILDERVLVYASEENTLRVFKGTTAEVMTCEPNCIVVSDAKEEAAAPAARK